tara:strand:+ start:4071 stop:5027 length:957 start_codon:yes stop_codon:yes gene_type:complete
MNKFDRVISLLVVLQSKKIVRAQDLAERFQVSLRTIYRDIRSLETAGIPIISEAGVGYSIMPGYHLPPVMFSQQEASAMITAEKLLEKMVDSKTADSYKSAMIKVKSVLRTEEKEAANNLSDYIEVFRPPWAPIKEEIQGLQKIFQSVLSKKVLKITYKAGYTNEISEREIEAIGVFFSNDKWYLIAFCRLRNAYRSFRLDRIQKLEIGNQHFQDKHPILKEYLNSLAIEKDLKKSIVRFRKESSRYVESQKFMLGYTHEVEIGDWIEMTFLNHSHKNMARWLMMFTNKIKIIEPQELQDEMKLLSQEIYLHFLEKSK